MRLGWIMRDTMIGFYDYTVILTYISLASSILGMISACYARIGWAIFFWVCLVFLIHLMAR